MENRHGSSAKIFAEVGSILIFATALFSLIALYTYSPTDPSLFSNAHGVVQNACGRVGAYFASLLLQCLGIGSFLLPAALFFVSAIVHKHEGSLRVLGTLGGMSIAVLSLTVFVTLQWKYWPYAGTLILTGGALGAWVAEFLLHQLNAVGASIVSLLIFGLAIVLSTPVSLAKFTGHIMAFIGRWSWRLGKIIGTYLIYLLGLLGMRMAHLLGDFFQKAIEVAMHRAKERSSQPSIGSLGAEATPGVIPIMENWETEATSLESLPQVTPTILPPPGMEVTESGTSTSVAAAKAVQKLSRAASLKRGIWKLPTVEFLRKPPKVESTIDRDRLIQNSQILQQKFADFGIEGEVTAVRPGPVITLYEFKPGPGVKVSRIAALADDLSMALSAQSVRILAPLPGKSVVGIEIPSETREKVFLREFLQHPDFYGTKHSIPVVMGKDIGGQTHLSDLARMPHLLCAGQTGAGKSVFMNGLICSLFYRFMPDELRMILVDPKFIEFRAYQDIPHLLLPVVDDPKHASIALKWAVREMERRYRVLAMIGVRNLATFNQKVEEMGAEVIRDLLLSEENQSDHLAQMSGGDWLEAFEPDESGAPRVGKLPYIVIIIDELADLMMIAKKEVEISIARIAQKARAAGIHLVIATQRPSTDVITGLIKANLPSRVSFQLASYVDSKTILDRGGAERLLGQGDMLFIPPGVSQTLRLHGAYVDDEEITKITSFLKSQGKPVYRDEILVDEDEGAEDAFGIEDDDDLFQEAVELVKRSGHASASFLQRHLKVGYNRAARMIETMEERGIVGPADGARPRDVLLR